MHSVIDNQSISIFSIEPSEPAIYFCSLAHSPRSIVWQRLLQNGRYGLSGDQITSFSQIGQFTTVIFYPSDWLVLNRDDEVPQLASLKLAMLRLVADYFQAHHRHNLIEFGDQLAIASSF